MFVIYWLELYKERCICAVDDRKPIPEEELISKVGAVALRI